MHFPTIDPLIAAGVVLSSAATDAVYVLFTASVSARLRLAAALLQRGTHLWGPYLLSGLALVGHSNSKYWRGL